MGHFKSFMLGVAAAFAVYYITRKNDEGKSIPDEFLDQPAKVAQHAKEYAIEEAINVLKDQLT